jgi:LuxR family transcriptional regulator, maltose regulon positive regulatory protein
VAWLALDHADNDPARFWRYLLAALERAERSLFTEARALLRSAAPIEAVLTCLLNRLAATPALSIVLALDDFHLIEAHAIHAGMAFLLDHAPSNLHVVLALREQPPQPLIKLRASGPLIELRSTDLRFTQPELAAYLSQVMDLHLSDGDMAALGGQRDGLRRPLAAQRVRK